MAANAPKVVSFSASGTADVFHLTTECKQAVVENYHASQVAYVKVSTGSTAAFAAAAAAAAAGIATVAGNDCYVVPAGKRKVVMKSSRGAYVACSVIASGAATTCTLEGSDWKD